jgi:hypothetical protein
MLRCDLPSIFLGTAGMSSCFRLAPNSTTEILFESI